MQNELTGPKPSFTRSRQTWRTRKTNWINSYIGSSTTKQPLKLKKKSDSDQLKKSTLINFHYISNILLFKEADGKECDAVDPCQWVHCKQNLLSWDMISLHLRIEYNQSFTMRMKNGFLFSLLRSFTTAYDLHIQVILAKHDNFELKVLLAT